MALALSKRLGGLSMAASSSSSPPLPATGLLLIGMGMGTVEGMTVEAKQAATAADHRRYEAYTALWPSEELARLESEIGPVERVMRPEVEQPEVLFDLAKVSLVALLVVGDPLQATTHVDLQLRATEEGIACHVIHGVSITTVVTGAIGLSNYKFGRQTTLTYPHGTWVATSPLEVIASNQEQNLHTLALLDLDPTGQGTGDQRPMRPADAVQSFELMWEKLNENEDAGQHPSVRSYLERSMDSISVVLCSDMGTPDQNIVFTTMGHLGSESGGRLNCLVFPANASEVEEKALLRWSRGE
ncbi:MAG: diphthine synthase [Poseidonia sp.]